MLSICVVSIAVALDPGALQEAGKEETSLTREEVVNNAIKNEYQSLIVRRMRMQIQQMKSHLELDAKTVRRLEVAAKGAARKVVEKYVGKINERAREWVNAPTISINGRLIDFSEASGSDEEELDDRRAQAAVRVVLNVRGSGVSFNCMTENRDTGCGTAGGFHNALEQELWRDSLAAVTTPEQRKDFAAYQSRRRRERSIDLLVSALSMDLELQVSQVGPVRKWIEPQLESVSESDVQSGARWAIRRVGRNLKLAGAEKFLSKDQLSILQAKLSDWR